jgi:hypothetical protein
MRYRCRSLKPTAALWLFVLGADATLAVVGTGALMPWTLTVLAAVGAGGAGVWLLRRRQRRLSG